MTRPDGRIEAGQRLSQAISARAWNRAQQAADMVLGGMPGPGGPVGNTLHPYTPILVCNRTTGTVDRWGCLSIDGLQVVPSGPTGAATSTFEDTPVLRGGLPTAGMPFVVPVEPIAPSGIGFAAVDGVVPVKLSIGSASHGYARAKNGTLGELETTTGGATGAMELLWKEAGVTGSGKWGLLRFGAVGGSSVAGVDIDVVSSVTMTATGIDFGRHRLTVIASTGIPATTLSTTGC